MEGGEKMLDAIEIFRDLVSASFPYAIAFWMGEMIVHGFLTMAFRGRIEI